MDIVRSRNNVPIRLTDERWIHIVENHNDLAGYYEDIIGTIENPDYIVSGYKGALIALKQIREGRFLVVVYKETSKENGFVITAYFSSKMKLDEEMIIWEKRK